MDLFLRRIRPVFFWTHLVSGVLASLIIAVMSATGIPLAYEGEFINAFDPAAGAGPRPSVDVWGQGASSITFYRDAQRRPVVMKSGGQRFVVDDTGALEPAARAFRFIHLMEDWHRWLGLEGEGRKVGRALTGAANVIFLLLGLTGVVIWWPKKLKWPHFRAVLLFGRGLKGWRRDFNWHHVIGFWLAGVLVVVAATGVVISYQWAQDLVATSTGGKPTRGPPFPTPPVVDDAGPPLPFSTLLERAAAEVPNWDMMMLQVEMRGPPVPEGKRRAIAFNILEEGRAVPFARHLLALHPYTGETLSHVDFESASPTLRARMVLRFLHTGEIFGPAGQLIAVLACVGSLVLTWTGLTLSWHRFFGARRTRAARDEA